MSSIRNIAYLLGLVLVALLFTGIVTNLITSCQHNDDALSYLCSAVVRYQMPAYMFVSIILLTTWFFWELFFYVKQSGLDARAKKAFCIFTVIAFIYLTVGLFQAQG